MQGAQAGLLLTIEGDQASKLTIPAMLLSCCAVLLVLHTPTACLLW